MTLINRPGSWQQAALASLDSGIARDIALMLADAQAVLDWLASGDAPPPEARQAAAVLEDTDSPYHLQGLATAVGETENMLHRPSVTRSPASRARFPGPDEPRALRARGSFSFPL